MSNSSVSIKVVNSISELNRDEWDRCAIHHSNDSLDKIEDPFTSYDFLNALEKADPLEKTLAEYALIIFRRNLKK